MQCGEQIFIQWLLLFYTNNSIVLYLSLNYLILRFKNLRQP